MGRIALLALMLATASPAMADRALIVGIDAHRDGGPSAAAADAARMHVLLTGAMGFRDAEVKILLGRDATRRAILDGLAGWLDESRPGERAVFAYAGSEAPDGSLLADDGGALARGEIAAALAGLGGRQVTAIIDARPPEAGTRAIRVEASGPRETDPPAAGGDILTWRASSPPQAAAVDEGRGVFTTAFADGIETGEADLNRNGVISNQELLAFVRARSAAWCAFHAALCRSGLTPTLDGPAAATRVAATLPAAAASPARPRPGDAINAGATTPAKILDVIGASAATDVTVEQIPPSPVRLGTRNIRFRVASPRDGFLVLLSVSSDGELVQLFPSALSDRHAKDGRIRAGSPIVVPDPSYGIRFDATSLTRGTILALVASGPLDLPRHFSTRRIEVIPQAEVNGQVLPELAQSLSRPGRAVERSIATLPYEIVP